VIHWLLTTMTIRQMWGSRKEKRCDNDTPDMHSMNRRERWKIQPIRCFKDQWPEVILTCYLPMVMLEQQSWPHPDGHVACWLNHNLWHARCPPWPHTGHQWRSPLTGLRHTLHMPAHLLQRVHHGDDTISGSSMPHLEQAVCMETPCRFIFEMYSSSDTEIYRRAEMTKRRRRDGRNQGRE
jgi:hypothetical protein